MSRTSGTPPANYIHYSSENIGNWTYTSGPTVTYTLNLRSRKPWWRRLLNLVRR